MTQPHQQPCPAAARRFIVQEETVCDGFVPFGFIEEDGKQRPCSYDTFTKAVKEVVEFFNDIQREIDCGERSIDEGYAPETFRIIDTEYNQEYGFFSHQSELMICYPDGSQHKAVDMVGLPF